MNNKILNFKDSEQIDLSTFSKKSYLEYSMYVISDRAIPFIGDGLKPVHRKILFSMYELGLTPSGKYKKSARTVGDVLGKYHPHGDSACYEAMVLMAQSFSSRYPLVDGQGNWGSCDDPKSFAAMRYTESKLGKYSDVLLSELNNKDTVLWGENFDGSLKEPKFLPAKLPNIILNGSSGIAVGMATDILPHNIKEISNACMALIDNPNLTIDEIMKFVKAPDFPTGGEIISTKDNLREIYNEGKGSIKLRAKYKIIDGNIVFYELPYKQSGSKIILSIADQIKNQIKNKKIVLIEDVRDESDHENPIRICVVPKKNVSISSIVDHLFATTNLEVSLKSNMNAIDLNGSPVTYSLKNMLLDWLTFRKECIIRKTKYLLDKTQRRIHILEGYEIAFNNIDRIIHIIRNSDTPVKEMMSEFNMSEIQAQSIFEIKLKNLARLEEEKIINEKNSLFGKEIYYNSIINHENVLNEIMRDEIKETSSKFNQERLSTITNEIIESKEISEDELTPNEKITVILSEKGWIKAGKGYIDGSQSSYKNGDNYLDSCTGMSNDLIVLFDDQGRVYNVNCNDLPNARSHGEPVFSKVNPPNGSKITNVLIVNKEKKYFICTENGYGYYTNGLDFEVKSKKGKKMFNIDAKNKLLKPFEYNENDKYMMIVSNDKKIIIFNNDENAYRDKGKGIQLIKLKDNKLSHILLFNKNVNLLIDEDKKIEINEGFINSNLGSRARSGKKIFGDFKLISVDNTIDKEENKNGENESEK